MKILGRTIKFPLSIRISGVGTKYAVNANNILVIRIKNVYFQIPAVLRLDGSRKSTLMFFQFGDSSKNYHRQITISYEHYGSL
jgi:hypothetical protein